MKEISPVINILTRTSGRPLGFQKCHESVINQTYENIRHIVSFDNPEDLSYINKYGVEKIRVKKKRKPRRMPWETKKKEKFEPYNLYCNTLLKEVSEGWIIFLDDDDMLIHPNVVKELVDEINKNNEETLILWKTRYPDGRLLPPEDIFSKKVIRYLNIDTACFTFHSRYKEEVKWDAYIGADYRFIEGISKVIPRQEWIPLAFTQKNNFGDHGRRNDITD